MQIIIAILLIGNYGLMDIFMLKGLVSKLIPNITTCAPENGPTKMAQVLIQVLKPIKVPLGDINWFYWVILGLFFEKTFSAS